MGRKKRIVIIALVALLVFIIVVPFTNVFEKAYANDGSTIAGVSVGTLSEDEIRSVLTNAIADWSQNPPQIEGGGSTLTVDPSAFQFDIDATLSMYNSLTDKAWYAFWENKSAVHIPLEITATESLKANIEAIGSWNVESTLSTAVSALSFLKSEPIEATVVDTSILESERLTFIIQDIPTTAKAVYDVVQALDGTVIGAGESFSFVEKIGALADNSNVEGLSFVASLLYRNALYTNTTITERHAQQAIPDYLEPGLESYVNIQTGKDLSFTNNSLEPIKMKLSVSNQTLKVEFFSSVIENTVTVQVTQADEIKPREIVRYTDDLSIGASRVLQKGKKGARVTVFRIIDGFEEQISRDYYPPTNRIIVKSSRQPVQQTTTGDGEQNTSNNGDNSSQGDSLDLDNDGLPDINQGEGHEPKVDDEGNVVQPDGTTTDKAGNPVPKEGN